MHGDETKGSILSGCFWSEKRATRPIVISRSFLFWLKNNPSILKYKCWNYGFRPFILFNAIKRIQNPLLNARESIA